MCFRFTAQGAAGCRENRSFFSHPCISSRHVSSSMSKEGESGGQAPPGFVEITEGRARILFPSSNEVFYNPVQEVNRDLRYNVYAC